MIAIGNHFYFYSLRGAPPSTITLVGAWVLTVRKGGFLLPFFLFGAILYNIVGAGAFDGPFNMLRICLVAKQNAEFYRRGVEGAAPYI